MELVTAEQQSVEQTARQFVRVNSLKVAEDLPYNEVAQALGDFETQERASEARKTHSLAREWQRWLVFDDIDENEGDRSELQKECKELVKVWLKMQSKHPECSELLPGDQGPPSVSSLKKIVESTVQGWESRRESGFGRAKQQFFSFCDALTSYSTLFSVIPQGSLYTSLFTGVIASLVKVNNMAHGGKASARHDQNADGISRALAEISADMTFTQKQGSIYPTERMKQLVILLYIKFVNFLCHAMNWYQSSWGRFKAAFDQNFYTKEVRDRVNEIKDVVGKIEREASLESQRVLAQTYGRVMQLPTYEDFESLMSHICRQNEISDRNRQLSITDVAQELNKFHLAIGEMAQNVATATVERMLSRHDFQSPLDRTPATQQPSEAVPASQIEQLPIFDARSMSRSCSFTFDPVTSANLSPVRADKPNQPAIMNIREELEKASRPLVHYLGSPGANSLRSPITHGTDQNPSMPTSTRQQVAGQIVVRLQTWISEANSQLLWIMSPPFVSARSEASLAAQRIIDIAERDCFPYIAVFLQRSGDKVESGQDGSTSRVARLIALLYSLIRQLILLLPGDFEDSSDLLKLMESLDGGQQSIPSALEAIRMCLRHAPSLLICVIDGIQLLDHEETQRYIDELLDILRVETPGVVLKVLLASDGFFSSGSQLEVGERLDCTRLPRRRPGRGQPGARTLGGISFSMD